MEKSSRIFIAGAHGLVGSALVRRLRQGGYINLLTPSRKDLDLTDQHALIHFFNETRPDYVFLAAALVGGIHANNTYPADFIYSNLVIQTNVIHLAWQYQVKRLLFLGSSCIYPKLAPQPMREQDLLTGALEPTNEPYALAKIAGLKMCEAFNRQHDTKFVAVMPTNLYGPGDNFHPDNSHVLPALLQRMHQARRDGSSEVVIWGTGKPKREFLYVDDMADGCVFVMELDDTILHREFLSYPVPCFANLGTGVDVTIRELAETIKEVVGFRGRLRFDDSKPDGTPRKLLDVSRLRDLGWVATVPLQAGVEQTYQWFLAHEQRLRV